MIYNNYMNEIYNILPKDLALIIESYAIDRSNYDNVVEQVKYYNIIYPLHLSFVKYKCSIINDFYLKFSVRPPFHVQNNAKKLL